MTNKTLDMSPETLKRRRDQVEQAEGIMKVTGNKIERVIATQALTSLDGKFYRIVDTRHVIRYDSIEEIEMKEIPPIVDLNEESIFEVPVQ